MKTKLLLILIAATLLSACMKENISETQYGKVTELFSIDASNRALIIATALKSQITEPGIQEQLDEITLDSMN